MEWSASIGPVAGRGACAGDFIRFSTHPQTACLLPLALAVHTSWAPTGPPALPSFACLPLETILSPCSAHLRSGRRHRGAFGSGSSPEPLCTRLRLSPVSDGSQGGPTASEHLACAAVMRVKPLLSLGRSHSNLSFSVRSPYDFGSRERRLRCFDT